MTAGASFDSTKAREVATPRVVGRYAIYDEIASGGMARVHLGRLLAAAGFSRTVAIKRLHPHFANDDDVVKMLVDEAHLIARVSSLHVVPVLEVVAEDGEVFLVLEYVHGLSLSQLLRASIARPEPIPARVAASILVGVLRGLNAAHEARGDDGEPLGLVHRDVSPQNILVGEDGSARVIDFGVAKARGRSRTTRDGHIRGKLAYMPPEQIRGGVLDRRTDVYAAGVVLWELLTRENLFDAPDEASLIQRALTQPIEAPGTLAPHVPPELDVIVMRALEREPSARYATALEMAAALEDATPIASPQEVAAWVDALGGAILRERRALVQRIEASSSGRSALASQRAKTPVFRAPALDATGAGVDDEDPFGNRRRRLAMALGAIALLLFLLVALRVASGPSSTDAAPSATPSASLAVEATSSAAPVAATSAPLLPTAAATSVAATTVSADAAPKKPRSPTATSDCKPPFWIDSAGHKHYKPACL